MKPSETIAISIKPGTIDNLNTISEIENECFSNPWPESALYNEIEKLSWSSCIVIKLDDIVAGYMLYWTIEDEFHLQKIAVRKKFRQTGLATGMMKYLINNAKTNRINTIFLELRQTNSAAFTLYTRLGFSQQGIRKKYYTDTGEDALLMSFSLKPDNQIC